MLRTITQIHWWKTAGIKPYELGQFELKFLTVMPHYEQIMKEKQQINEQVQKSEMNIHE